METFIFFFFLIGIIVVVKDFLVEHPLVIVAIVVFIILLIIRKARITKKRRIAYEEQQRSFLLMGKIDTMKGNEFEQWCVLLLENFGFYNLSTTKSTGDHGIDIIGYRDGVKYAIQCKRYSNKLGNKPIQEVYTGKALYGADIAVVMTNSNFTKAAQEEAETLGVLLWDRSMIADMLTAVRNAAND